MTYILLEGWTDKEFLDEYLKFLKISQDKYEIRDCGGCKNIDTIKNELQQIEDQGEKVIVVFDADQSYQSKLQSVLSFSTKLCSDDVFLFPNNQDAGELETLLFAIATEKRIVECFDGYKQCINEIDPKYCANIHKKSARFAYFQALGYSSHQKDNSRKSAYTSIFNFKAKELDPLEKFLRKHFP